MSTRCIGGPLDGKTADDTTPFMLVNPMSSVELQDENGRDCRDVQGHMYRREFDGHEEIYRYVGEPVLRVRRPKNATVPPSEDDGYSPGPTPWIEEP